ncbi:hypothetical protein [Sphingomonas sp. HDW15A]|uniref:hypothetical protein n=1 Tax=Sphingomonas sp. HDW15A TaxID=2714942 RepID=UPI001F0ED772|nr:hypothetical protein [Sphingomonas sp. HDW15A]
MDGLIALAGSLLLLLTVGGAIGLLDRRYFNLRWLLVAALLVAVNDALLTNAYGLLPNVIDGERNWQGKILALAATLAIATLPAFGWRSVGLTLRQNAGSLVSAVPVALLYCAFFLGVDLAFSGGSSTTEEAAFQLTMPGLEEEPFYRGSSFSRLIAPSRGGCAFSAWIGAGEPCCLARYSGSLTPSAIRRAPSHSI